MTTHTLTRSNTRFAWGGSWTPTFQTIFLLTDRKQIFFCKITTATLFDYDFKRTDGTCKTYRKLCWQNSNSCELNPSLKSKASPPPESSLLTSRVLQELLDLCTSCCIKIIAINENYNAQTICFDSSGLRPLLQLWWFKWIIPCGVAHQIKPLPKCHQADVAAGG